MLCVCALLHCQQICAERKFRKIERTYLHSLYSCTTSNVTMCFNSLEWRAWEVCLLQNNFSELWLINSLNEWTIHHCAKKKKTKITIPPIWQHASIFRSDTNESGLCVVIGSVQSGMETAPLTQRSDSCQSDSCFGMVQVNCPFDDISFFLYISQDWFKFVYLLFF